MDGHATNMQKNDDFTIDFAIFTKALPTDGRTDGRTDRPTDIPSYRDAIAASNKVQESIFYIKEKKYNEIH